MLHVHLQFSRAENSIPLSIERDATSFEWCALEQDLLPHYHYSVCALLDWIAMSYNHLQIIDAVHSCLRAEPRISLAVLSDRLRVERHTIRRALLGHLGMTFRDLQQECLLQRASEVQTLPRQYSRKETSLALGYRSSSSLTRLIRRARVRNLAKCSNFA